MSQQKKDPASVFNCTSGSCHFPIDHAVEEDISIQYNDSIY